MDWSVFWPTFVGIFLAEIGDKTQFAAVAASSRTQSTVTVLLAVVLALGLAGTIGVLAGRLLGQFINPAYMRWISGGMFVAIGIWILSNK